MSIRVLVISNYLDYHTTRPEASIFLGLARYDFDIHIMTFGSTPFREAFEAAGITLIDFHPVKKFDKKEIQFIKDYIVEHQIQVIHLFNNEAITNGIQAARKLPVKVVLYRGYSANINWWDPTAYTKFLHPRVDKIFCNSIGVEQLFHRQLFFKKSKAITINKGHDVSWYDHYKPYDIRKELGLDPGTFLFVNVANNRRMKGIPYLLEAFNKLPSTFNCHLLLIGRDMDNSQNMSIIKRGDSTKVHLLGFRKEVLPIVAACDVFVLSSIKGESITKSVIEAMSLEVTPIITDIAGNVELLEHEKSGLVVASKNAEDLSRAMRRVYEDQEWCKMLGKAAKLYVEQHLNTKQTVVKTKQLYEDLVKP